MKATDKLQSRQIKTVNGELKTINYQLDPLDNETVFWFDDSPTMYHGASVLRDILKKCSID